jgi:hypothetical protein
MGVDGRREVWVSFEVSGKLGEAQGVGKNE